LSANLNWVAGQPPVSNAVTSDISADGKISFYNLAGSVNLSADIVGYYVDHNHDDRYLSKISFAQAVSTSTIAATDTEITKLSDVGAGGALVVQNSVRIVLTGTVTVGNSAGTGEFSIVSCQFQMANNGGAFAAVGSAQTTESIGNNNHDQTADVALVAVTDRPAGSYNVRVVCRVTFGTASSGPRARSVGVSVVASPV
jgi:hypothetical protein